ncbi:MAG: hypothetical protein GX616_21225, partial [Planctomycetes bacterium]|nr:hypothetical protein [Planctomycetota bacterium]
MSRMIVPPLAMALALLLSSPHVSDGASLTVQADGSGTYATIQAGIDAASDGDEVVVGDGLYTGEGNLNITLRGKKILVRSEHGPAHTIIEGNTDAMGFACNLTYEGPDSVIDGFTVRNCGLVAISCYRSSPTIRNCVITSNHAANGGGVFFNRSTSLMVNCVIAGNSADYGGGILCSRSSPVIANCLIAGNGATYGGAIACWLSSCPVIANCTITGNSAEEGGGLWCWDSCAPKLFNSIMWDNSAPAGPEMMITVESLISISYSTVTNGQSSIHLDSGGAIEWLAGAADFNPLFVDPDGADNDASTLGDNDYRLAAASPCIDSADSGAVPASAIADLLGRSRLIDDPWRLDTGQPSGGSPVVDMGAYE